MHIQWFPGHMTKSMRMIQENLPLIDAVVYVLDSRAAASCLNPSFDKMITAKKKVYVLNKADLSDPAVTKLWQARFEEKDSCVSIDGTKGTLAAKIIKMLYVSLDDKLQKQRAKGIKLPLRIMVIGIPNSGKSTIINSLCGGKRAKTGDKPGVTRGKQWIRIQDFELLDTPGTLWNAFADQTSARHLAYIGSINDDILDSAELAGELLLELKTLYPQAVLERYRSLTPDMTAEQMLKEICALRGFLQKGGLDLERGGKAVIDDFRKGRIGRISLERP